MEKKITIAGDALKDAKKELQQFAKSFGLLFRISDKKNMRGIRFYEFVDCETNATVFDRCVLWDAYDALKGGYLEKQLQAIFLKTRSNKKSVINLYKYVYIIGKPRSAHEPTPEIFKEISDLHFNKWIEMYPDRFVIKFEKLRNK